jgi:hypothetical protein
MMELHKAIIFILTVILLLLVQQKIKKYGLMSMVPGSELSLGLMSTVHGK